MPDGTSNEFAPSRVTQLLDSVLAGVVGTAAVGTTSGGSGGTLVDRLGGPEAVRVVQRAGALNHAAVTSYGTDPWAALHPVLDVEVIDPSRVPTLGRLFTAERGNLHGRWGAFAEDVTGLAPRQLASRFNLDASAAPQLAPDRFATRALEVGDRLRIGREGAPAYTGSLFDRLATFGRRLGARGAEAPVQLEFLDYPGSAARGAVEGAEYLGRFGAPAAIEDAAIGASRLTSLGRTAGTIVRRAALPVAAALTAAEVAVAWHREGSFGPMTRHTAGEAGGGLLGGVAGGLVGGALAGAALGSVLPVAGTAIGGIIGGIVGSIAGRAAGGSVVDAIEGH